MTNAELVLVKTLEEIRNKAFYHMVRFADQRGDRKVLDEIKEMTIAALKEHTSHI